MFDQKRHEERIRKGYEDVIQNGPQNGLLGLIFDAVLRGQFPIANGLLDIFRSQYVEESSEEKEVGGDNN